MNEVKCRWVKLMWPEGAPRVIESISNDSMVNWEEEPGYFLLTFMARIPQDQFVALCEGYHLPVNQVSELYVQDDEFVWLDLCQRKLHGVWQKHPELYARLIEFVLVTPDFIHVAYCHLDGSIQLVFTGSSAADVCKAVAREALGISVEHALYLGRELQRMVDCLTHRDIYVQD